MENEWDGCSKWREKGFFHGSAILKVYEESTTATSVAEAIGIVIMNGILFLIPAFVILRKKKMNEVIEN